MKILAVFDSDLLSEKMNLSFLKETDTVYLFPLTSQVAIATTLERKLKAAGCDVKKIKTATAINASAQRLRGRYIRFIAELPEKIRHKQKNLKEFFAIDKYASLWWLSLVSEKNIYKSDTFNTLVQLDSIIEAIKFENIEKIIFGCRNRKLKNGLSEYLRKVSMAFETLPVKRVKDLKRHIRTCQKMFYLRHILYLLNAALKFFLRTRKIKRKMGKSKNQPLPDEALLMVTYYPNIDTSAAEKGIFDNKYYMHLQRGLEDTGKKIVWIAMYVYLNCITLEKALDYAKRFREKGYLIFFPEEFNSIKIQIKTLMSMVRSGWKFLTLKKNISKIHNGTGYDFYPVLKEDWYSSFVGAGGYFGLLYYNIFKSLLNSLKVRKCLYLCEMHAWERALISARDAINSTMLLFGYQHATVPRMLLNYFNDPDEINEDSNYAMPRPDKIVCNSRLAYNNMRESGWPEESLVIVEAIRYNHFKKYINLKWNKKKDVVLLAFSINPKECSSMLNITHDALKDIKNIEVWLKPHPALRMEQVFKLSGISAKNYFFQIKDGPLEEILSETRIVIAGQSSVSLEALACGCEIIIANVPEWINMSPLKDIKNEMIRTVDSAEELKKAVIDIFKRKTDPREHVQESIRIINDYFYLNQNSDIPENFLEFLKNTNG